MISFSHPWALLLSLPAAWLLWRSRRPAVQSHAVANLFLWLDAPVNESQRSLRRRSLPPWLVWLQAAALVALAVAIASPLVTRDRPDAALVIDLSMSMSAREGATSRMDLAKAAAKAWLLAQPSQRLVEVVGANQAPLAVAVRAGSPEAAAAIDALTVTDQPDNIVAAVELARRDTAGEIVTISDLPSPADAEAQRVTWKSVGTPVDNVAITALTSLRDGSALLEVTNFGGATRSVDVEVTGGPAPWHDRVEISPFGTRPFHFAAGPDRTLAAELKTGDGGNAIAADDRARTDIKQTTTRVRLASNEPALRAALGALPDVQFDAQDTPADVIVTSGAPGPASSPSLVFTNGGSVPNIARTEVNGVRRISVDVDLTHSPWPLTPAFPIFIADSVEWLTRQTPASFTSAKMAAISESDTRHADPPHLSELALTPAPPAPRSVWLVLTLLGLSCVLVDAAMRRRSPALRAIAAAIIVAAAAGVPIPIGSSSRSVVIALDSSASMAGNQRKIGDRVRAETDAAGDDNHVSTIRFGGTSTDIAAGLRQSRAAVGAAGDRRLLLVSDGQQTDGDAIVEARHSMADGVPIDVVPVDSRTPAFVERMDAPVTARAGARVPVRIVIKGAANEIVRLALSRDARELDSRRVVLNDSGRAEIEITDTAPGSGMTFYRAVLSDERLGLALSESGAAVTVTGRGRVLIITDRHGAFAPLISSALFDVVQMAPVSAPNTREGLASFSAIVIDAVPPHRLTTRQLGAVAEAVAIDGAGLLFLGSRESLDASEFSAGAFSDALPIDFTVLPNPPSSKTSLALLVDISGSMASTSDGVTKISAARDAITRALAVIPRADAVEVVGFAAAPVMLIGPNDPRDAAVVQEKLKSLSPSGSTALAPAVADAVAWLKQSGTQRRRLLLVTDGKTSVTDAEATRNAVGGQGIEVSVITIGGDAERAWLTELAASTGGRAYFPDRLTDLAREVAREAARGASGREINERFTVRAGVHPLAPGDSPPVLGGYIAGRLRDGATAAWKARSDDAVLAAWPRGLGRVAVFSSELGSHWTSALNQWPQNSRFWARATEWLARGGEPTMIEAELTLSTDGPRIVVDLGAPLPMVDGAQQLPAVLATVASPAGQASTTVLHAVTATRFEGPAPLGEAGDYRATISVVDPRGAETRTTRGWYWTGEKESASRGLNLSLLQDIARTSGGRMLPMLGTPAASSDSVFSGVHTRQPVNAVPWFLFAALALLSFDYIRRATEVL